MRFYTKEWHTLMNSLGTVDLFRPVIDKEYSDEEIEELYQEFEDRYIEEERAAYDAPPVFAFSEDDEAEDDELDAAARYQIRYELEQFENREPFDEEEAREDFRENYNDFLEEPDEDIPEWILDTVDIRLLAMGAMPEGAYKRLMKEEEAMQERFDELDEAADDALEDMYDELYAMLPDEYPSLAEDLEELDGEYLIGISMEGDELEMEISGWDEEGEPVRRIAAFDGVQIIEDEGAEIEVEVDEDGEVTSDCDIECHELYFEDGRFEVHFLLDDGELKYLTFSCDDISIMQSRFED